MTYEEITGHANKNKLAERQALSKMVSPSHSGDSLISAVDLFCGAGGLTHGLVVAGIKVEAGIDIDEQAAYAYEANNAGARFLAWDLVHTNSQKVKELFHPGKLRLLAGCAPCKPFSQLTNRIKHHKDTELLDVFGRFVNDILPDYVVMENVPELARRGSDVFNRFLSVLGRNDYNVDWKIVNCAKYGVPQTRRRLILIASRLGAIAIPPGQYPEPSQWKTVRQTIGSLRPLSSGETDPDDPFHSAPRLSRLSIERLRATPHDGGSPKDWDDSMIGQCHRKKSGERSFSVYGRMWWDRPAPTITTRCNSIGNGRVGHPEQDRPVTLREAALLQSFPEYYVFWPGDKKLNKTAVARFIGNAVPPKLAEILGKAFISHALQGHFHAV